MLDRLDGLGLVDGLYMQGHDLAGVHFEEILEELVRKVRGSDRQVAHGPEEVPHLEGPAPGECKCRRRYEVLHRQPRSRQPVPLEPEPVRLPHVEHVMHETEALLPVQGLRRDPELPEIVHKVVLDVLEPRLCLLHIVRLDPEREVFRLCQPVVPLGELHPEHLAVLVPDGIELVLPWRDSDALLEALRIRGHIHEGELEVDRAVKEVEEAAPFFEDGRLVLLLGQLVIDVLELYRLRVIIVPHPADAVREHPLERDGLLRRPGNAVIPPRLCDDPSHLLLLLL